MADYDYDLFVIGAGSGGVRAARLAAVSGARVAVAENDRVGGTCVIRGCVPKKLMHYGAHFAEWFKAARHYGWDIGGPKLAFEHLCTARNTEIARLNGIYIQMLERAGVRLYPTRAHLSPPAPGEPLRVAFVGQAVERKGLPVLLRAFEALRSEVPAELVIVGATAADVAPLLEDGDGVRVLGPVGDA